MVVFPPSGKRVYRKVVDKVVGKVVDRSAQADKPVLVVVEGKEEVDIQESSPEVSVVCKSLEVAPVSGMVVGLHILCHCLTLRTANQ
jgi:hypothetical protein